ncbi:hypothetical protein D3C86_1936230 [compost metagenome]
MRKPCVTFTRRQTRATFKHIAQSTGSLYGDNNLMFYHQIQQPKDAMYLQSIALGLAPESSISGQ